MNIGISKKTLEELEKLRIKQDALTRQLVEKSYTQNSILYLKLLREISCFHI